ncbi:sister chromatid cohesion protein PDS5 homolog C-like isoform X3 [Brassica napus]|uniref:sister chromatid cohesion protein PDS5 homolog C-like isoform X3 n=1 Tax=Brassica napus TaxID=3708 RepID=UPI0020786E4D|nr:sister chromatid cohesion protein PDS5 homolog C-like isoform X3 [Brassica napus]
MSDSEKEIENQILEAGEKLVDPPSSLDELLPLLDKIFTCLVDVEQSPPASMQNALSPLMTALVDGKLVKHSDIDVKVAVAACISEITRITAPDAPYDDDKMREVFKLIVSSFENLDDDSSRSYSKRTSILETVAKVRSCVVMLDLECDSLLIEMFQNFLKAVRDHHTGNLFSSMENIMTLVLEESEEIPPKMLSPILHYVRKDDEVPQVSRSLAEQVLSKCASKLKNYLTEAVKSSGVSLDKYSKVVASICEGTFSALQQDQLVENEKEDSQGHLTKEAEVEDKQEAEVISTPERTDPPKDESSKSGVSNGIAQQNDSSVDTESTKKLDDTNAKDEPEQLDNPSNTGLDNTSEEKPTVEHQTQEREPSSVKEVDSSKSSDVKEETEPEALLESKDVQSLPPDDSSVNAAASENDQETSVQAFPSKTSADETANVSSPSKAEDLVEEIRPKTTTKQKKKGSSTKEAKPSADETANVSSPSKAEDLVEQIQPKTTANQKKKESSTKEAKSSSDETANVSSPSKAEDLVEEIQPKTTANQKKKESSSKEAKPSADETATVSSPSNAEDLVEETRPKTTANQKKKESSGKEAKPSAASVTEEAPEETNTSEAKVTKKSGKKVASSSKAKSTVSPSKKSTSETKAAKQSEKKAVESDNVQESSKPKVEKKKTGRGKAMDDNSSGDSEKPAVSSGKSASKSKKEVKEPIEESPNTSSKRKRSLGKASDLQTPDGNIVGSRVRVWWPIDKAYYKGVVDSYDSAKKRHLVIYDDGDQEILNLKKQKWHFLDESETEQGEEAADQTGHEEEEPQSKKAKTGKQSKIGASGKKGGGAGSSKSKATPASKSGKKSQDDKPKDSKAAKGKAKSTPASKTKDSDVESESEETPKAPEPATKGKSVSSGKSQASQSKSGKKRKR